MPKQLQKKHTQTKTRESEEVVEIPVSKKRDDSALDEFLEKIDELLEEDTDAEALEKATFKEKLRTIQFGVTPNSGPQSLMVTAVITCQFRCENCICGR